MNVEIPVDLHDAFKAAVEAEGKKIKSVIVAFIQQYVQQRQSSRRGGARK